MLYTPPTPDLAPQRKKVEVTGEMVAGKRGGQGRWLLEVFAYVQCEVGGGVSTSWIKNMAFMPDMVAHVFKPSTQEAEAAGSPP